MPTIVRLTDMPNETGFAPLGVLGYCLTRTQFLAPVWAELDLGLKTVDHCPASKLQDVVTSILAGCRAISQVNTRLRPDLALARAWNRKQFADQSQLARTLDTFAPYHVAQLRRSIVEALGKKGFRFIEVISPCPTLYERRNRLGDGLTRMKFFKENSETRRGADTKTVDISFQEQISVGKFVDVETPTYIEGMNARLSHVLGEKYQPYEGVKWA